MKISEVLDKAADLIEPEGKWIQGASAKDANGRIQRWFSPDAVCWCWDGAMCASSEYDGYRIASAFVKRSFHPDYVGWNDHSERTQSEVVAKSRELAALARSQGL